MTKRTLISTIIMLIGPVNYLNRGKPSKKVYRNPIILAREMSTLMEMEELSRAELARKLGISRARVTQILNLLKLPEELIREVEEMGDQADCTLVGELLTKARQEEPDLDSAIDSIMHEELIDSFSDAEMIHFFWFYFAYVIDNNAVPEP